VDPQGEPVTSGKVGDTVWLKLTVTQQVEGAYIEQLAITAGWVQVDGGNWANAVAVTLIAHTQGDFTATVGQGGSATDQKTLHIDIEAIEDGAELPEESEPTNAAHGFGLLHGLIEFIEGYKASAEATAEAAAEFAEDFVTEAKALIGSTISATVSEDEWEAVAANAKTYFTSQASASKGAAVVAEEAAESVKGFTIVANILAPLTAVSGIVTMAMSAMDMAKKGLTVDNALEGTEGAADTVSGVAGILAMLGVGAAAVTTGAVAGAAATGLAAGKAIQTASDGGRDASLFGRDASGRAQTGTEQAAQIGENYRNWLNDKIGATAANVAGAAAAGLVNIVNAPEGAAASVMNKMGLRKPTK
jgi:hypothetical protein